eukprot:jgi/Chrzof1/1976/Cz10g28170.t1
MLSQSTSELQIHICKRLLAADDNAAHMNCQHAPGLPAPGPTPRLGETGVAPVMALGGAGHDGAVAPPPPPPAGNGTPVHT